MAEDEWSHGYGDARMFHLDLDDGVVLVARRVEEPAELHPEEAACLSDRAVPRRRADFAAGRTAARQALTDLGVGPSPVGKGAAGEPLWPPGVVGSITHGAGWALALVGRATRSGGLGIDLEAAGRYFPELVAEVAFGDERDRLDIVTGDPLARGTLELFAVKEAIYKAFYPRVREFFGFEAVRVGAEGGDYRATFRKALDAEYPPGREFSVRLRWIDDLVVAWVILPPD